MMSTLSFTNLANICDTARFMAEKHIFMSTQNSKYQSTACFSFFSMTNISYMEKINRQHLYLEKERITFILLKNNILDYQLS